VSFDLSESLQKGISFSGDLRRPHCGSI